MQRNEVQNLSYSHLMSPRAFCCAKFEAVCLQESQLCALTQGTIFVDIP